ncbi:MAG TPA: TrkH family potassium uptake protein [Polyangiaceae bacterium LLY-WYZ-14_1]|nr:TrkH family potassium uptake protein [Polyangiaceae bacterium LLY-WYZ-14_1]
MNRKRRDYRGVVQPVAVVVLGLGFAIGICAGAGAILDAYVPRRAGVPAGGSTALLIAAAVTLVTGAGLFAYGRRHAQDAPNRREATLAVVLIWAAAAFFGGIPFVAAGVLSPVDAFFESMSGLTTTGATVVTDIEGTLSRPLLLWRSLLQWLGGMGIVVLFVAVFPTVGAGGKHMFRGEVPGTTAEGLRPRIAETSFTLWRLYAALTAVLVAVLVALGMSPFEAVCHAFTTMSTGGFSTRDASIAAFRDSRIELTIAGFMLVGSINYGLYFGALRQRTIRELSRNLELRTFLVIVLVAASILTLVGLGRRDGSLFEAFRYGVFTTATFVSSTGYGTEDYMAYPPIGLLVVLFLMFAGGCSGSTAGGIKIERFVVLAKLSIAEVTRSIRPNVIHTIRINHAVVKTDILSAVSAFAILYVVSLLVAMALVMALDGAPVTTAFGAVLSCLSNMGPAPFHGGADHFAGYSVAAKLVFTLAMLLGRLEFFTVLALLAPSFWKR